MQNEKKAMENLTFTKHIQGNVDRLKQSITYLTNLCIRMVERGLGEVAK